MNKNLKEIVSYSTQIKHQYFFSGAAWIIAGACQIVPYKVFSVVSLVFLLIALYFKTTDLKRPREDADEMAETNINIAMARTLMIGEIILILSSIIIGDVLIEFMGLKFDISKYLSPGMLMFVGLMDFLVGLFFKQEEE